MGTTVAPQASSIAGSVTSYAKSGGLGGFAVDLGSVYNSLSDSGGVMGAARDDAGQDEDFRMQGVRPASLEAVRNIPEEKLVAMLNAGEISPQQVADAYGVTVADVNNSLVDINMQASLAPANTGVETGTPSAEAEALTALGEEISELVSTIANSETATEIKNAVEGAAEYLNTDFVNDVNSVKAITTNTVTDLLNPEGTTAGEKFGSALESNFAGKIAADAISSTPIIGDLYDAVTDSNVTLKDAAVNIAFDQAGLGPVKDIFDSTGISQATGLQSEDRISYADDILEFLDETGTFFQDQGFNFANGVLLGTEMISNSVGASNAFSDLLQEGQDILSNSMSDGAKAKSAEMSQIINDAEGTGWQNELKAGWDAFLVDPVGMTVNAAGTIIPSVAAAVAAGPAVGGVIAGGVMGAGTAKGALYEATYNGLIEQGVSPAEAEAAAFEAQSYTGDNLDAIGLSTVTGLLAGSTGSERLVSGVLRNIGTKKGLANVVKEGLIEAGPESLEGAAEAIATNKARIANGEDINILDGVFTNAALEGLAGKTTGASVAAGSNAFGSDAELDAEIANAITEAAAGDTSTLTGDAATAAAIIAGTGDTTTTSNATTDTNVEADALTGLTVLGNANNQLNKKIAEIKGIADTVIAEQGTTDAAVNSFFEAVANIDGVTSSDISAATGLDPATIDALIAERAVNVVDAAADTSKGIPTSISVNGTSGATVDSNAYPTMGPLTLEQQTALDAANSILTTGTGDTTVTGTGDTTLTGTGDTTLTGAGNTTVTGTGDTTLTGTGDNFS